MNIHEMHFDFKVKFDKVDSNIKRNFNQAQIDWLLREGEWAYLEETYGVSIHNPTSFEGTEKHTQSLKALHVKSPEDQVALVPSLVSTDIYQITLENLDEEFLFSTRLRAQITQNGCTKIVGINPIQTDDLNDAIVDPFSRPNFKFGKVLGSYGRTKTGNSTTNNPNGLGTLYLYSKDFTIDNVYIDYIKYPQRMWIGTYDLTSDLRPKDGTNTYIYQAGVDNPVNCELNGNTHHKIVDYAVSIAAGLTEDPNLVKLKQQKILINK